MQFHSDESIALLTGEMPSSHSSERAVDFLPQMIETRDSLNIALHAILAAYQINDVAIRVLESEENEKDLNMARSCVKYIKNVKILRTEIVNKRKAVEQSNSDTQPKEDSQDEGKEQDRKLTPQEQEETQNEPSSEPSAAPSSILMSKNIAIPTGAPSTMPTEMSGDVYAASLLISGEG